MSETEEEPRRLAPPFFSLEFHFRFLPGVIWRRRAGKREPRSPFANHFPTELLLVLVACIIAILVGLPASHNGSLVGGIAASLGTIGLIALFVQSVCNQWGRRPTFDEFLAGVFVFLTLLGGTIGLMIGWIEHFGGLTWAMAAGGLVVGYLVGIGAGLWGQTLGWIAKQVEGLAFLGCIGLIVLDLVILFSLLFG
jgi:hypothetical protein